MYKEAIESAWQYLIKPIKTVPGRDDLMVIASQVSLAVLHCSWS